MNGYNKYLIEKRSLFEKCLYEYDVSSILSIIGNITEYKEDNLIINEGGLILNKRNKEDFKRYSKDEQGVYYSFKEKDYEKDIFLGFNRKYKVFILKEEDGEMLFDYDIGKIILNKDFNEEARLLKIINDIDIFIKDYYEKV